MKNTTHTEAVKTSAVEYARQYSGMKREQLLALASHCERDGAGVWSATLAAEYRRMASVAK